MMDWLAPRRGQRLLDVAGGTGDIAFRFLRRAGDATATVLDLTTPMLEEGRKRAEAEALADRLDWVTGDAMALPFDDASFDVYTISFGIRNVTRPEVALSEAFRVLRPGGRPDGAGVQPRPRADASKGVRPLLIQCHSPHGAGRHRGPGQLSVPRGVDPALSRSGDVPRDGGVPRGSGTRPTAISAWAWPACTPAGSCRCAALTTSFA